MKIFNTTQDEIKAALAAINIKYDGNIVFGRFEASNQKGTTFDVTLSVASSKGKGGRLGFVVNKYGNRRHICAACYHAFGDFFDALIGANNKVVIKASRQTIDKDGGNWEDRNIGSLFEPLMYSEACDCIENGLDRVAVLPALKAEPLVQKYDKYDVEHSQV